MDRPKLGYIAAKEAHDGLMKKRDREFPASQSEKKKNIESREKKMETGEETKPDGTPYNEEEKNEQLKATMGRFLWETFALPGSGREHA